MSNPELIGSPETTHEAKDRPGPSRMKKTKEFQNLSNALEGTASVSPGQRGDNEVKETNDKEDQHKQGKVTLPRDPADEVDPLKKRKVSPTKPTSLKKYRATLTKMQTVLTVDDFEFIITTVVYALQDILQKHEAKEEEMYDRIEVELRGVKHALQSSFAVSTVPPP
jgi:hypothetical protein